MLGWDDAGAESYWVLWRKAGPGNPLNEGVRVSEARAEIEVEAAGDWVVRVDPNHRHPRQLSPAPAGQVMPTTSKEIQIDRAKPASVIISVRV